MLEQEEMSKVFDQFINENGLFQQFKTFIESQGYTLAEFGMEE